MMRTDAIDLGAVAQLMPLHLVIDAEGEIVSGGPTMRKLIGPARSIAEAFGVERPHVGDGSAAASLSRAARTGERIFLRQLAPPFAVLRGHAVPAGGGRMIVNLGFGIGLPQSIRALNLTDADFAPSDLAMELLFLHEANSAAMSALSRYNSQLDEARQAAMAESVTDPLTGLANRRGLDAALAHAARAARPGEAGMGPVRRSGDPTGFALITLDLDGFKAVNDQRGHAIGDALLQHVAAILREETRASDTVARPGGDEFVLILGGVSAAPALAVMAARIIERISRPVCIDAATVRVSASLGVAASGDFPSLDAHAMLASADGALYAAKGAGRGCAFLAPGPAGHPVPLRLRADPAMLDPTHRDGGSPGRAPIGPVPGGPASPGIAPAEQAWPGRSAGGPTPIHRAVAAQAPADGPALLDGPAPADDLARADGRAYAEGRTLAEPPARPEAPASAEVIALDSVRPREAGPVDLGTV